MIAPRDPPAADAPLSAAGRKKAAAAKRAATVAARKAAAAAASVEKDNDVIVLRSGPSPEAIAEQVQRLVAVALAQQSAIAEAAHTLAAAKARETATAATPREHKVAPRGANSDKYRGDGGLALDAWVTRQSRQLAFYEGLADGPAVAWLATALEGAAGDWYDEYSRAHGAKPTSPTVMFAGLRKRFQPVDSAETARRDLDALQQGKGDVNAYTTRFRQLLGHLPNMDNETRMWQYRRGLRAALQGKIAEAVPQPTTLEAFIELAARYEGRAGNHGTEGLAAVDTTDRDDAPMTFTRVELNALIQNAIAAQTRSAPPGGSLTPEGYDSRRSRGANKGSKLTPLWRLAGLTQEEGNRRRASNLCMWCAAPAHIFRDCPDRAAGKPARLN